jgi:hypothetical protein
MIKIFLSSLFLSFSTIAQAMNPEAATTYRKLIENYKDFPTTENAIKIFDGLETCGRYIKMDDSLNVAVYKELRNAAVAVPQHVDILTKKVESARAALPEGAKFHSGAHNQFQRIRCTIIRDTMCHIPSPEVVRALGKYLDDDRDTPPPMTKYQDWIDTNANSYLACTALQKIGLRDCPLPVRAVENADNLATWKLWWGPIEAGNRTFSFEGQDVEYLFRKDGTYETLSRDGAQKRIATGAAGETKNPPTKIGKPMQRWLIFLGGCATLCVWLRWKAKRGSQSNA